MEKKKNTAGGTQQKKSTKKKNNSYSEKLKKNLHSTNEKFTKFVESIEKKVEGLRKESIEKSGKFRQNIQQNYSKNIDKVKLQKDELKKKTKEFTSNSNNVVNILKAGLTKSLDELSASFREATKKKPASSKPAGKKKAAAKKTASKQSKK